jgi:hypothetical protein
MEATDVFALQGDDVIYMVGLSGDFLEVFCQPVELLNLFVMLFGEPVWSCVKF